MPANIEKADGQERLVGVEFELQGVEVDQLAGLTASTLDGTLQMKSSADYRIAVPNQGEYRVEVDYALLKEMANEYEVADADSVSVVDTVALVVLSAASSLVVPCEVVTPPLSMTTLPDRLEPLTVAIRDAGGKGTGYSPLYAFGLHLNVEPPTLDAETVTAFMKSFVCLFDWLTWKGEVDIARRATPYIQRYPADYELRLADPGYWPDWRSLIDDYLEFNPSRNRALDMLPLFSHIDPDRIHAAVSDGRVQSRPAFHYRLANCSIDEPGWSISKPWSHWLQIEHLASHRDALAGCCAAFLDDRARVLHKIDNNWRDAVNQWLDPSLLA